MNDKQFWSIFLIIGILHSAVYIAYKARNEPKIGDIIKYKSQTFGAAFVIVFFWPVFDLAFLCVHGSEWYYNLFTVTLQT